MKLSRFVIAASSILAFIDWPASAQTNRELAVAIDRLPAPASDPFEVEVFGPELRFPWSLAFLPDGNMLVTERHGGLRLIATDGSASAPIEGGPDVVVRKEDSGLLDVVLDPDFATNRWVYVAFVEGTETANRTAIWRARFDSNRLIDGRVIFRTNADKNGTSHPGGRILFLRDGTLLLTVGDGYDFKDQAQAPASHLGKVLRLTRDGAVPADNPFVGRAGYAPEIWTMGHRNIQGLALDSATGEVWSHEHGPRGGDEVNRLEAGKNYGWPLATLGIDYDGKRISNLSHIDGMSDPQFVWSPSIAPSGLAIYRGDLFPDWRGRLLVGALAARSLVQLRPGRDTGLLVEDSRILSGQRTRIRDVRVAPDGRIYLLTDDERGRIWRLSPAPKLEANLPDTHPLSPIAFLVGEWLGEARYAPPAWSGRSPLNETSRTSCQFILGNAYLRCITRFRDQSGAARNLEHNFRKGRSDTGIQARLLEEGWAGDWVLSYQWDPAQNAFVAERDDVINGRPVRERTTLTPSADRKAIVQTDEYRLRSGSSGWQQVFRWTLRKDE